MLRTLERFPRLCPAIPFHDLPREEQALLITYSLERELEELELRVGKLHKGKGPDKDGGDPDDYSDLIARGHKQEKERGGRAQRTDHS